MKKILAAAVSGLCASLALPLLAAELVMTAPRQPSAGQPTTLVFQAATLGFDLDPGTQPATSVDGSNIRINLNAECDQAFCDSIEEKMFRVELPALDEGNYQVGVYA